MLDKLALDKEKRDLLQENTQLRAVLKQYLDGKKTLSCIVILLRRGLVWEHSCYIDEFI